MENKIVHDSFPEETNLSKELMILKSQEEMAQMLLLVEAEGNDQEAEEKKTSFNVINLPYANSHPH